MKPSSLKSLASDSMWVLKHSYPMHALEIKSTNLFCRRWSNLLKALSIGSVINMLGYCIIAFIFFG